jgi:hypothetical protein
MAEVYNKPPLGIVPEFVWRKSRARDLLGAIDRYVYDNKYIDLLRSWEKELSEHLEWLITHDRV